MTYESTVEFVSKVCPGVLVALRRISFARRGDLLRAIFPMASRLRTLAASQNADDQAAASNLRREISEYLLRWGIEDITGLQINGVPATKDSLLADGPEDLTLEILAELQSRFTLSEAERKN